MSRNLLFSSLVFLTLTTGVLSGACKADTYYVRQSGDDGNPGSNRSQPFRTIGKAASVAGPGDVVFIGAGTYEESVRFPGANLASNAWQIFFADRGGVYTGDKGDVIIRAPERRWACRIFNSRNILFYGITFTSQKGAEATSYGCLSTNSGGYTYYYDCRFIDLAYGVRDVGKHSLYVSRCEFSRVRYGIYTRGILGTFVGDCQFAATRYGCIAYDGQSANIIRCEFSDRQNVGDPSVDVRGVYARRTGLRVAQCSFKSVVNGVYGTELVSAAIEQSDFSDVKSHAVRCDGQSLSISNSTIREGKNGITLGDTSGGSATISNVDVEGMRIAIMAHQGDYVFQNVNLRNNTYGIYQRSGNRQLTIAEGEKVAFAGNDYAIYTNHKANEEAFLSVTGTDFTGNDRGLVSYRTSVKVKGCKFGGEKLGAYLRDCPSVQILRSEFHGNSSNPHGCTYGLYARSGEVEIEETAFENSRYGIMIQSTSDDEPKIRRVRSSNHTVAALYLRDGRWTYDGADENFFSDSPRGVVAHSVSWQVEDVTSADSCLYPLMDYYGACTLRNVVLKGKVTGLYAYRSKLLDVGGLKASGSSSYAIRLNDCEEAQLDNCLANQNGHGCYLYSTRGIPVAVTNSRFIDNAGYGLLASGTTIDADRSINLEFRGNKYGLRVNNQPLTLTSDMGVSISENEYGVLCSRGVLLLSGLDLVDNATGVYSARGGLLVSNCKVSSSAYGILGYVDAACEIKDSTVSGAANAIRLITTKKLVEPLEVENVNVSDFANIGLNIRGNAAHKGEVSVLNCRFRNGHRGIVTDQMLVKSTNVSMSNLSSIGIYQVSGSGFIRGCRFNRLAGGWAVLARGKRCDISTSEFRRVRYGIGLMTSNGSITNSLVADSDYGLYLRRDGGRYVVLHTTVSRAKYYGLLRYQGRTAMRNCVIDAGRFGVYDAKGGGRFNHQSNLVYAGGRPFVNTSPGDSEITDRPYFVNADAGDYHLASGSPAINSGEDLSGSITSDLDGNVRPSFGGFEMGAYEYMDPSGSIRVLKWDEVARQ